MDKIVLNKNSKVLFIGDSITDVKFNSKKRFSFKGNKIYSSVCVVKRLLDYCAPEYDFNSKLKALIAKATQQQKTTMGFPAGWENELLFK